MASTPAASAEPVHVAGFRAWIPKCSGRQRDVCSDAACDSTEEPPPGEQWCRRRLAIELERWFAGHRMVPGPVRPVSRMLDDDPVWRREHGGL